jgi:cysteine desulfurase
MLLVDALKGSLGRVVQLTRNFTSETSLHREVIEAISAAFEAGWADPKKISQSSARAAALRGAAIDELADFLKVSPSTIEPVGEPALLHQLAIEGYLRDGAHFVTSNLDVGKVRAIAHRYSGPKSALQSDSNGILLMTPEVSGLLNSSQNEGVISLQQRNGEIGTTQDISSLIEPLSKDVRVILDCTKAIPSPLNPRISAATFDATSWQGPAGLGFLVINNSEKYRYPLPHLAPIRTPGSYSLPLLVGTIVALDLYKKEVDVITKARSVLTSALSAISGVAVIGAETEGDSRYISIVIDGVIAEECVRELNGLGIAIDAGSACSPDYLAPSHVITSLGFKAEGQIRITLNTEQRAEDISKLIEAIKTLTR